MVVNSAHIALPGDEWERRAYYHHSGFAKGASWTVAYKVHENDPTMVSNECHKQLGCVRSKVRYVFVYPILLKQLLHFGYNSSSTLPVLLIDKH